MKRNLLIGIAIVILLGIYIGTSQIKSQTVSTPTLTPTLSPRPTLTPALMIEEPVSLKELQFMMDMRKLWEDHITWTRMYMVAALADSEDKESVAERLLKNQDDLGNAIKPYYGENAGNRLTTLLKEHILTAADLIDAAKANNQQALNDSNTKWYRNANEIADFLSAANPNLNQTEMRTMMKEHLDLTKQEALDILNKRFDADIADYDRIHNQILRMSDTISTAIINQFPDKF